MNLREQLGEDYMDDFEALNRKDGAIIKDAKFVDFLKKHLPFVFKSGKEFNEEALKFIETTELHSTISYDLKPKGFSQ